MYTKKALTFFFISILLTGGFPDFRVPVQTDYRFPEFSAIYRLRDGSFDASLPGMPDRFPSPDDLIATATPVPTVTPAPTATPAPTVPPEETDATQATKPGDLTFTYPETAPLNTDPSTYTFLVNKEYPVSSAYEPYMVEPEVTMYHQGKNERRLLQPVAATALEELFAAAEADGFQLVLRCGYRSYKLQDAVYASYLSTRGYYETTRFHAPAGTSEHQTGLSVDLCCEATDYNNNYDILKTKEYKWLLKNAHLYGWILRYPEDKTDITGVTFEPWHFRYVGVELATYLKEHNLVLEEYYGALPSTLLYTVPEKYWDKLSEEDYALMLEELEAYQKQKAESEVPIVPEKLPIEPEEQPIVTEEQPIESETPGGPPSEAIETSEEEPIETPEEEPIKTPEEELINPEEEE